MIHVTRIKTTQMQPSFQLRQNVPFIGQLDHRKKFFCKLVMTLVNAAMRQLFFILPLYPLRV